MQSFSASAPGILKHPLIRGADFLIFLSVSSFCDSSPLARGRPSAVVIVEIHSRFIPSCEGQTLLILSHTQTEPIHPLLRGADRNSRRNRKCCCDSSPLARGRRAPSRLMCGLLRFIPSCEGQTTAKPGRPWMHTIHPLLRGADLQKIINVFLIRDSSPLARGRLFT